MYTLPAVNVWASAYYFLDLPYSYRSKAFEISKVACAAVAFGVLLKAIRLGEIEHENRQASANEVCVLTPLVEGFVKRHLLRDILHFIYHRKQLKVTENVFSYPINNVVKVQATLHTLYEAYEIPRMSPDKFVCQYLMQLALLQSREKTGSILQGVVIHMTQNTLKACIQKKRISQRVGAVCFLSLMILQVYVIRHGDLGVAIRSLISDISSLVNKTSFCSTSIFKKFF
jgi:hypothetical protein